MNNNIERIAYYKMCKIYSQLFSNIFPSSYESLRFSKLSSSRFSLRNTTLNHHENDKKERKKNIKHICYLNLFFNSNNNNQNENIRFVYIRYHPRWKLVTKIKHRKRTRFIWIIFDRRINGFPSSFNDYDKSSKCLFK